MRQVLSVFCLILLTVHASNDTVYIACLKDPLCRNLFQQEHGELSEQRFSSLMHRLPSIATTAEPEGARMCVSAGEYEQLIASQAALLRLAYSESRCPPNTFWRWNATTNTGACTCYLDRDCRTDILALCHPEVDAPLLVSAIILIVFAAVLVLNQNFCPAHRKSDRTGGGRV